LQRDLPYQLDNHLNTLGCNIDADYLTCYLLQRDLPYELDHDLKTLGTTTLGGAVDTEKQFFGAHYRVVSEPDTSKRLIGFNFVEETTLSGGNGVVHFWEFDESFKRLHKTQHKMPVSLPSQCFTEAQAACIRYSNIHHILLAVMSISAPLHASSQGQAPDASTELI